MQPQAEILQNRLKDLPKELRDYIGSDELQRRIDLLAKKHSMNTREQTIMENEVAIILMVLDSTDNLAKNLQEGLVSTPENSNALAYDIKDYILKKVDKLLAHSEAELILQTEKTVVKNSDSPNKEQILQEIENPRKTKITKYIIEYDHQPIKDSSHLIEDKVDEVRKLRPKWED